VPPAEASEVVNGGSGPPAVRERLPSNLDEEQMTGEGEKVAQVASSFAKIADLFDSLVPPRLDSYRRLREFVMGKLDEEQARAIESQVHALQSKYDTYIQHTATEAGTPDLRRLRSIISILLHLFEVSTHLVHFYERHENDIRSASAKERIAGIVDKNAVLDRAVNYAFRSAGWFTRDGREIALRLIPEFTSIQEVSFEIPEDVKLHIRPAALIASVVNHHGTPVWMRMGEGECDASSVTDVIFLAGTNPEAGEVVFRGDRRPLGDLAALFEVGLADDGHERILERLPYLKGG
jgi:phosphotransferase system HPr-like phosphotransfer protein